MTDETATNVRSIHGNAEPDPAIIRQDLEAKFGGDLGGLHDCLVEIAWSDPRTGHIDRARLFATDELDEAAAFACETNHLPGQNVFVGIALRKPEAPRTRRSSKADVAGSVTVWADLDAPDAAERAPALYRHCKPTSATVTGRTPHKRAQLFWRLDDAVRDQAELEGLLAGLAQALGGDAAVVDAARVMRLAGTIAWPFKPGRVIERTELHVDFPDRRPEVVMAAQIARAFPAPATTTAPDPARRNLDRDPLGIGGVDPVRLLRATGPGNIHDNLLRVVAHCVAAGYPDWIIHETLARYLDRGRERRSASDVQTMIDGAHRKWGIADPGVAELEEFTPPAPLVPQPAWDFKPALIPPRPWVLDRLLLRRALSVTVAPPGTGKSTLSLEQAVAVATGCAITGERVCDAGKVWVYNNEEDLDELRRRLAAILAHWSIPQDELAGRLFMNSGVERPLLIARQDRSGNVVRLPDVESCIERIREHDIRALIVDPFVETHALEENSNVQIKEAAVMFREIAHRADCAVMLVHHTAKPPQGGAEGFAGNMNAARGASALVGVARVVVTLFTMSAKDAEACGIPADERHHYLRFDDAKGNAYMIDGEPRWYRRTGVAIANGEEVGVLEPVELAQEAAVPDEETEAAVMAEINRAWRAGEPYGARPQCGDRYYRRSLARRIGCPPGAVVEVVDSLMSRGAVEEAMFNTRNKAKGLRIVPFDERTTSGSPNHEEETLNEPVF